MLNRFAISTMPGVPRKSGIPRMLGVVAILGIPGVLGLVFSATASAALPNKAAVASAHPLATQAGHEILSAGGNAFDAAVAVTATLAVVEPASSGLGGGGFWLLHRGKDGIQVMVDGRERAPLAASKDMYIDKKGEVIPRLSVDGPLAAGIPGEPAAIVHLASQYGRLPLSVSLAPAIRAAKNGFPVDTHYQRLAKFRLEALRQSPAAAAIFLDNNNVPELGHQIKQADLAVTLQALAEKGRDGFYSGSVAEQLVNGIKKAGGIWSLEDLASYTVVEREPVRGHYGKLSITSAAPPSSGGIALLTMLNILSGYNLDTLPESTRKHLIIEAMRRAYRDRAIYLGDPDYITIPVQQLTHPLYAAGLRAGIHPDRATPSAYLSGINADRPGADTSHFSILDKEGNRVAATLSINFPFGSGFMPAGTGVLLNDEMDDFSAKPGVPNVYGLIGDEANAIVPGKRPLSSMTPTFVDTEDGVAIIGTPGGSRIITMVLLAVLDVVRGAGPESWVGLKRYHHQYLPDVVSFEPEALTKADIEALEAKGHILKARERVYGNMQAIYWNKKDNKVEAASDPRRGGLALIQ